MPADLAMKAGVRHILDCWPAGIIQDGDPAQRFAEFALVPFRNLREVFVYRDQRAFESWERLGADRENADQMVHLLVSDGQLTIVVDRLKNASSKSIVDGLSDHLRHGMPRPVLRRAA
jgi:hypothetical protein